MSMDTPSLLFTQYTDLLCDQTLEEMFAQLFSTACEFSYFCAVSVAFGFRYASDYISFISCLAVSWESLHTRGPSTDK